VIAIPIVLSGRADVLALPAPWQPGATAGNLLGVTLFMLVGWALYRVATRER
jgi:hypothetical protein